jgi:hypothetical protein
MISLKNLLSEQDGKPDITLITLCNGLRNQAKKDEALAAFIEGWLDSAKKDKLEQLGYEEVMRLDKEFKELNPKQSAAANIGNSYVDMGPGSVKSWRGRTSASE